MIRFLHLSDVHLNAGFANKSSYVRNNIKNALYEAIVHAIDYTLENELEGLIIAGDFFDDDKISFKDEFFVMNQLKRVLNNNQKIFYVTGNHDPMFTARFLEPITKHEAFYFFDDDTVKCLDVLSRTGIPYKVVGVGHLSKNEQRNLIKTFPIKSSDEVWIGIAHASVPTAVDIADKTRYMATSLAQIEALNYDYFALGHIHIRQLLTPKIGYSGNLQGLNIKEIGPKGGFLVTLEMKMTKVEPIDFNVMSWAQCDIILPADIRTLSELQQVLIEAATEHMSHLKMAAKQIILRINIKGRSPLKSQLEVESNRLFLTEMIMDKTGLLDCEIKLGKLTSHYDLEALSSEHTILSQMILRISNEAYEEALLHKIYHLPIFSSQLMPLDKSSYINAMREDLLYELIERMVVQADEN